MPQLPRRLRRPRSELRIELSKDTPPEFSPGGVAQLLVRLSPLERFRVRCGRLELALLTTRFSRTALDGYHEYTAEEIFQTAVLCESTLAYPGKALLYSADLLLPDNLPIPPDSRPTQRQWQARARFEADGYRELQATRVLLDASPQQGGVPVVDGRGFLPF
jgi:hypothetical protein